MTGNPYEAADRYGDTRTSIIAVVAAVFAFIICIPPLSLVGMILGWVGLRGIDKSQGRVTGKPFAVVAIVVGLIVTVIQFAIGAGMLQAYTFYTKQMIPRGGEVMAAVEADDMAQLEPLFTQEAFENITPDRVSLFRAAYTLQFGEFEEAATDVGTMMDVWASTYSRSQNNDVSINASTGEHNQVPVPVPLVFSNGSAILWVVFDANTLGGDNAERLVVDLVLQLDAARGITLREEGPSKRVIRELNLNRYTLEEIINEGSEQPALPEAPAETPGSPE